MRTARTPPEALDPDGDQLGGERRFSAKEQATVLAVFEAIRYQHDTRHHAEGR